jgi:hypothetical protein
MENYIRYGILGSKPACRRDESRSTDSLFHRPTGSGLSAFVTTIRATKNATYKSCTVAIGIHGGELLYFSFQQRILEEKERTDRVSLLLRDR